MDIATEFKNAYGTAIGAMLHPGDATKKTMSVGDALKFYYLLMIIPLILGVIVAAATGSHVSSNPLLGTAVGTMMIILMLLIYIVIIPVGIIVDSGIYHLIIKSLFKMYKQNYNAAFTAFTYGMIPVILVYWLLSVPLLGMVLIIIFGLWALIVEIIAISNQLSMSRLKAFGTILLDGIVVGIIMYVVVAVVGLAALFSLGVFNSGAIAPTTGGLNIPYTTINFNTSGTSGAPAASGAAAPGSNQQPETNLGSATGSYDGVQVQLTIVPQRTVENFADASLVGILYNFSTTNSSDSCLDGSAINVWTAPAEYPGYLIAHNGGQGAQCRYITAIFKQ